MDAHFTMRAYGVNQTFRFVESILHLVTSKESSNTIFFGNHLFGHFLSEMEKEPKEGAHWCLNIKKTRRTENLEIVSSFLFLPSRLPRQGKCIIQTGIQG